MVRFECQKCGRCCYSKMVSLTGRDINRIALAMLVHKLGHDLGDYIIIRGAKEQTTRSNGFKVLNSLMVNVGSHRGVISLDENPNKSCIFLKNNQCIIYDFRPVVCRCYPFSIKWNNKRLEFIPDNECPGLGMGDELPEMELDEIGLSLVNDTEEYKMLVEEWNAGKERSSVEFFKMVLSYGVFSP